MSEIEDGNRDLDPGWVDPVTGMARDDRFDRLLQLQGALFTYNAAFKREARRLHDEEGLAWARIAKVLGVTRQAAWERFSKDRS